MRARLLLLPLSLELDSVWFFTFLFRFTSCSLYSRMPLVAMHLAGRRELIQKRLARFCRLRCLLLAFKTRPCVVFICSRSNYLRKFIDVTTSSSPSSFNTICAAASVCRPFGGGVMRMAALLLSFCCNECILWLSFRYNECLLLFRYRECLLSFWCNEYFLLLSFLCNE